MYIKLWSDSMRIYLDTCCYNRRYDDKSIGDIFTEYKNVIEIQKEIVIGKIELATSFMLHYENYSNKNIEQRDSIDIFIKTYRKIYIGIDYIDILKEKVKNIKSTGIKDKDAYHWRVLLLQIVIILLQLIKDC